MSNINVRDFLKELSSLSPLTGEYETNIISLCMYSSLLQKNANQSLNRLNQQDKINFENYIISLDKSVKNIYDRYYVSAEFINNYMIAIKMPKNTDTQINKYEETIDKLTIKKINSYIDIASICYEIISGYDTNVSFYKEEYKLINKLCIENIKNIQTFILEYIKETSNDIVNPDIAFDIMQKIKKL